LVDNPKPTVHTYTPISNMRSFKCSPCILFRQIIRKYSLFWGDSNKRYFYLYLDDSREIVSHLYLHKVLLFCPVKYTAGIVSLDLISPSQSWLSIFTPISSRRTCCGQRFPANCDVHHEDGQTPNDAQFTWAHNAEDETTCISAISHESFISNFAARPCATTEQYAFLNYCVRSKYNSITNAVYYVVFATTFSVIIPRTRRELLLSLLFRLFSLFASRLCVWVCGFSANGYRTARTLPDVLERNNN